MSDIDKWKTQPCKNCMIKKLCRKNCFSSPSYHKLFEYTAENPLNNSCLYCGNKLMKNSLFYCIECGIRKKQSLGEYYVS